MAMLKTPQAEGVGIDRKKFRANYEAAFGHTEARIGKPGRYVWLGDRHVHIDDVPAALLAMLRAKGRKRDATNIVSSNLACLPRQIPDWKRRCAELGLDIKFEQKDPHNVQVVMKNRATRLKFLKARGMIDHDEVRGGKSRF